MGGAAASDGALARFQAAFTAYIRDPEHATAPPEVTPERMALYSRLVFGNCERVMSNMFPVLKQVLPEAQWQGLARSFFRDHPMHDPLFQAMPQEFVRYLQGRPRAAEEPPFLLELAHYEWVDYALSVDEAEISLEGIDADGDLLEGRPALNPLVWMLRYEFPVHTYREHPPAAAPASQPTYLVACRALDDRVHFMELNAVSARLLELIDEASADTGRDLLRRLAGELQQAADALLDSGLEMLRQLRTKAVLLGTRSPART